MVAFSDLAPGPTVNNVFLDTLIADFTFRPGYVISYAFIDQPLWDATGSTTAFTQALGAWTSVANIQTQFVANYTPALRGTTTWVENLGNPSGNNAVLGQHSLPGTNDLEGYYNQNHALFSAANNVRGGFSFITFLHEIGHGLGLEHSHPDVGTSGAFPGVSNSEDIGDFGLNQGIYTVLGYNDGSTEIGLSPSRTYGWALGPLAFDIAAIQRIYGANTTTGAGDSVYTIQSVNAVGTGYASIWDVGGNDTLTAAGIASDVVIDLRAATLQNEVGGGGWLSRPDGIYGGFTIANSVVIENAIGGSGRDRLVGNSANNNLNGGAGFDVVDYSNSTAGVIVDLSLGTATGAGIGTDTLVSIEHARGGAGADRLSAIAGVTSANSAEIVKPAGLLNNSQATAVDLNGHFGSGADANIANASTTSHATVKAVGNGAFDFYKFTVGAAGGAVTIYIDGTFGTDTVLALLDSAGTVIASNDDGAALDPGTTSTLDSLFTTATLAAGTYTIRVGTFSAAGDAVIPLGQVYTLNVSAALTAIPTSGGQFLRGSVLEGGAGGDILTSGAGNDILDGGLGRDSVSFSRSALGVTVSLMTGIATGDGTDTLIGIESLVGSAFVDNLTGDANANSLLGGDSGDQIDGGMGDDVLLGENGDDTLIGGAGNDSIVGGIGADRLFGGTGTNELQGGDGDDVYFVEGTGDSIIEAVGAGVDEVQTNNSSLTLANNVENLKYTGVVSFIGNGNAGDNAITGGIAGDQLSGLNGNDTLSGGAGSANVLIGGIGNDIYIVAVLGDSTIEIAGQGIDEVRTTFSVYGLQANVENLTYTDNAAHGAGVGNALDNIIIGGTGNDELFARAGNDTLRGGAGAANTLLGQEGDDLYIVDATGDSVIEFANQGTDTVQTALSQFVLRTNVENLTYTGVGSFTGIGADGDNEISGGASDDFLSGLGGNDIITGGSGADLVQGGSGSDQFRFIGGETGFDRILDFQSGSDKIGLLSTGFSHSPTFLLVQGGAPVATNANSTFLYNVNNGILSYDADGGGGGSAIILAQLNAGLTLAAGDFLFY